jgi:hypothetical protein
MTSSKRGVSLTTILYPTFLSASPIVTLTSYLPIGTFTLHSTGSQTTSGLGFLHYSDSGSGGNIINPDNKASG